MGFTRYLLNTRAMALVTWTYSDWDSQSTAALKLDRLRLHIQEVSGYVLKSGSKGRNLELDPDYLPQLNAEKMRLEQMAAVRSVFRGRFGVSSFDRGGGS